MRALAAVAATALLAACGVKETATTRDVVATPEPVVEAAAVASPAASASDLPDPEPPDAQARAEAVVNADFNRNKRTSLAMNITTIAGSTSSIQGFSTGLAENKDRIEDRLARLQAKVTETEVTIQLPGAILFDFDSARIRPDAERTLEDVQQVITAYAGRPVRVDGHTDSIASDDYNLKLSQQRAQSVTSWLASHGIELSRLQANGVGEGRPVATNETAAGRQLNRRVEIVIAKK